MATIINTITQQANPSATLGQPTSANTYVYSQTTSTVFFDQVVSVPTSGSITLALPVGVTNADQLTLVNIGTVIGTQGSEVWVNLKGGATQTIGISLPAPPTGTNSGGQFTTTLTQTASQTNQLVITGITLALPASQTYNQLVWVFIAGH